MMKGILMHFIFTLLALSYFLPVTAQSPEKKITAVNHQLWGELLQQYVDAEGYVDYVSFGKDVDTLDEYLELMASFIPHEDWPKAEVLAYYINLYNAATVRLILKHYPVESIRDIKQPWARKWIRVGEKELSLNQIEHKILRKMNEPRIHFAINCASTSCPKLLAVPFEAQSLEEQLEEVSREFINDTDKNIITGDKIALSPLFKWYKNDFTADGDLLDFISHYTNQSIPAGTKASYLKYDWSLNEQQ